MNELCCACRSWTSDVLELLRFAFAGVGNVRVVAGGVEDGKMLLGQKRSHSARWSVILFCSLAFGGTVSCCLCDLSVIAHSSDRVVLFLFAEFVSKSNCLRILQLADNKIGEHVTSMCFLCFCFVCLFVFCSLYNREKQRNCQVVSVWLLSVAPACRR